MSTALRRLAICAALGLAVSAATQPLKNVNPLAIMGPGPLTLPLAIMGPGPLTLPLAIMGPGPLTLPLAIMGPGPLDAGHERVAIMGPGPLRQRNAQQVS